MRRRVGKKKKKTISCSWFHGTSRLAVSHLRFLSRLAVLCTTIRRRLIGVENLTILPVHSSTAARTFYFPLRELRQVQVFTLRLFNLTSWCDFQASPPFWWWAARAWWLPWSGTHLTVLVSLFASLFVSSFFFFSFFHSFSKDVSLLDIHLC